MTDPLPGITDAEYALLYRLAYVNREGFRPGKRNLAFPRHVTSERWYTAEVETLMRRDLVAHRHFGRKETIPIAHAKPSGSARSHAGTSFRFVLSETGRDQLRRHLTAFPDYARSYHEYWYATGDPITPDDLST